MDFDKYIKGNALFIHGCVAVDIVVKELVRFLQNETHITELGLEWCKIDDEDAKELAKLTHLTSLDLSMNNISDKGAKALASLTSLTRLNLLSNNISVEGAKALANGKLKNLK
ncbi:MAG: AAA family ATPase, partial [Wolbachia endosymbiont of Pissodes strobi]|nr:AAA family ATPase [Wolbachia endosymbiont of Pissodes strobi]